MNENSWLNRINHGHLVIVLYHLGVTGLFLDSIVQKVAWLTKRLHGFQ